MKLIKFGFVVALLATPFAALANENISKPAFQYVAEGCMPCKAKCRKCTTGRGRFATVQECYADCNRVGNPSVNATCGTYARCGR